MPKDRLIDTGTHLNFGFKSQLQVSMEYIIRSLGGTVEWADDNTGVMTFDNPSPKAKEFIEAHRAGKLKKWLLK